MVCVCTHSLSEAKASSLELHPGLPRGSQWPGDLSHHLLPSPVHGNRKLSQKPQAGIKPRLSDTGCVSGISRQQLGLPRTHRKEGGLFRSSGPRGQGERQGRAADGTVPCPLSIEASLGPEISCQDTHHFLSLLLASPRALIWGDFEPQLPRS